MSCQYYFGRNTKQEFKITFFYQDSNRGNVDEGESVYTRLSVNIPVRYHPGLNVDRDRRFHVSNTQKVNHPGL